MAASLYEQVISAHRTTLDRLIDRGSAERLKNVYDKAAAEVVRKLESKLGRGSVGFSTHHLHLVLAQLKSGQVYIDDQLFHELSAASREAQVESLRGLARNFKRLEKKYTGHAPVLPIEEAARFARVVDKGRSSLLRQHRTSIKRYGMEVIDSMQDAMSISLAGGETLDGAIARVHGVMEGEWWRAERVARTECLLGDTKIESGVIRAIFRRRYQGDILHIRTHSGRQLSATPNHPVLTRDGWIAAKFIKPGDDLVCHSRNEHSSPASNENVAAVPSSIAEIFDAIQAVTVGERRRGGQPDFHGDGMDGDVDVLRPNGELLFGRFIPVTKPTAENLLSPTAPSHLSLLCFCGACGRRLFISDQGRDGDRPEFDTASLEVPRDHGRIHTIAASEHDSAFPIGVSLGDDRHGEVAIIGRPTSSLEELCPGCRERTCNAVSAQCLRNPRGSDPKAFSDIRVAEPLSIQRDRVVDVRCGQFSGHVFNLSTADGHYAANGIYTMNCAYAANLSHSDGIVEIAKEETGLMQQWIEFCAPDGRPLDDRVDVDSIAMHGQLTEPGGVFTMPASAPFPNADGETDVPPSLVGKSWAVPPCRPNGRETVQAWKKEWGVPGWKYVNGRRVWLNK